MSLPSIESAQEKVAAATGADPTAEPAPAPATDPEAAAAAAAAEEVAATGGEAPPEEAGGDPAVAGEDVEMSAFYDGIVEEHLGAQVEKSEGETDEQHQIRMLTRRVDKAEFIAGVMREGERIDKRYPGISDGVKQTLIESILRNDFQSTFNAVDKAMQASSGQQAAGKVGADVHIEGEPSSTPGMAADSGGGLPTRESIAERIKSKLFSSS